MSQNYTHFPSKDNNANYAPFVGPFWSDQVMLLDSFRFSGPLGMTQVINQIKTALVEQTLAMPVGLLNDTDAQPTLLSKILTLLLQYYSRSKIYTKIWAMSIITQAVFFIAGWLTLISFIIIMHLYICILWTSTIFFSVLCFTVH